MLRLDTKKAAPQTIHDGETLSIGPVEVQFRLWSEAKAKGTVRITTGELMSFRRKGNRHV